MVRIAPASTVEDAEWTPEYLEWGGELVEGPTLLRDFLVLDHGAGGDGRRCGCARDEFRGHRIRFDVGDLIRIIRCRGPGSTDRRRDRRIHPKFSERIYERLSCTRSGRNRTLHVSGHAVEWNNDLGGLFR